MGYIIQRGKETEIDTAKMSKLEKIDSLCFTFLILDQCPEQYQTRAIEALKEMRKLPEKQMIRSMTALLFDGLAYGNWPGAIPGDTIETQQKG